MTIKKTERKSECIAHIPEWMEKKTCPNRSKYLSGQRILPKGITGKESAAELVDNAFLAYNAARLREASMLFSKKMLESDVTVGMTLAGALTPAGLGPSAVIPLINAGFVDWIIATGANMYHDLHFAFNYPLHAGSAMVDDTDLRKNNVVRIYDVLLDYTDCLLSTDEGLRRILVQPEFQKEMGTAEMHYYIGKYAAEWENKTGMKNVSILAAAYRAGVPIFTSSPGDSTIGMNIAGLGFRGNKLQINPTTDVNQTTAIVLGAKRSGGKSAVMLMGGGSPKNFMLQTEPQIQEILCIPEFGQDYFLQVTDARPDTGGLSGATPHEAVSWGKIDPNHLPDAVVCYTDTTIALPILTHYALANREKRPLKRLYDKLPELGKLLTREFFKNNKVKMLDGSNPKTV